MASAVGSIRGAAPLMANPVKVTPNRRFHAALWAIQVGRPSGRPDTCARSGPYSMVGLTWGRRKKFCVCVSEWVGGWCIICQLECLIPGAIVSTTIPNSPSHLSS